MVGGMIWRCLGNSGAFDLRRRRSSHADMVRLPLCCSFATSDRNVRIVVFTLLIGFYQLWWQAGVLIREKSRGMAGGKCHQNSPPPGKRLAELIMCGLIWFSLGWASPFYIFSKWSVGISLRKLVLMQLVSEFAVGLGLFVYRPITHVPRFFVSCFNTHTPKNHLRAFCRRSVWILSKFTRSRVTLLIVVAAPTH